MNNLNIFLGQEYQRGSSGFFSFLRCQFLGIGERTGSEGRFRVCLILDLFGGWGLPV